MTRALSLDGTLHITLSIPDLKAKVNTKEFILDYLGASSDGTSVVICPFHDDNNKSLAVYDDGYYCFGCNNFGDVFDFLVNMEKITLPEAIKIIEDRYGMSSVQEVPEMRRSRISKYSTKDVYDFMDELALECEINRGDHANAGHKEAVRYLLEDRGIGEIANADMFRVGYYDTFPISEKNLEIGEELGLVSRDERPYKYKGMGRIFIPIINVNHDIVSITTHSMPSYGGDAPKYVNLRSMPNCKRGSVIYGEHLIYKHHMGGNIFITEGYFDAISLYKIGVNGMAIMGSCISDRQMERMESLFYKYKFIIAFDGDDAGREGASKTQSMFIDRGLKSIVFPTPEGKDINDMVKAGNIGSLLLYANF